jgi:UDP-2,3-diacylglucosamine pyrophosphatase LpxH
MKDPAIDRTPSIDGIRRQERSPRHGVRAIEVLVLSDVHLGARCCRAEALLAYLDRVRPRMVVLNGDIIDAWEFDRRFWPAAHAAVARRLLDMAASGVPVYYVAGNHDAVIRGYAALQLGALHIVDEVEIELDGVRHWFVHGDQIEARMGTPRWMSLIGTVFYDSLVLLDDLLGRACRWLRLRRPSSIVRIKHSLPGVASHLRRYQEHCVEAARERGFGAVVTGHVHCAGATLDGDRPHYLNTGDWVESLTALEYDGGWTLVTWRHEPEPAVEIAPDAAEPA